VQRIVVVSIVGTDRFTGGYIAAKVAHEQAMLAGPSRCEFCARRSFTSSSRRSWSGADRTT
jgi:hypothetical protein